MNNRDLEQKIQEFVQLRKRRKRWYKLTAVLAAVAVVVTTGSLVLPAMTMEKGPEPLNCQLDLHTHEESCYGDDGELLCGYADFVVHEHDASCYDEEGVLICPLEEIKAHTHSISCYEETRVLTCGMEEGEGHTHNASCYGKSTEPTCGLEEKPSHVTPGIFIAPTAIKQPRFYAVDRRKQQATRTPRTVMRQLCSSFAIWTPAATMNRATWSAGCLRGRATPIPRTAIRTC